MVFIPLILETQLNTICNFGKWTSTTTQLALYALIRSLQYAEI